MSTIAEHQFFYHKPSTNQYTNDHAAAENQFQHQNMMMLDNSYWQYYDNTYHGQNPMLQQMPSQYGYGWQSSGWPHGYYYPQHPQEHRHSFTTPSKGAPFKNTNSRKSNAISEQSGARPEKVIAKNVVQDDRLRNKKIMELGKQRKWKEILRVADEEKDHLDYVNWSTAFSQLSKIKSVNRNDPLFLSFVRGYKDFLMDKQVHSVGIRELANAVHSIGKMQLQVPAAKGIIEFVSRNAKHIVQDGKTQEVGNICWSLAKLRRCLNDDSFARRFLAEVDKRADWLVNNGRTQEIANAVWACATLNIKAPRLFSKTESCAKWLVENGSPQGVSNTAWAFATMGFQAPTLFSEIAKSAAWLVKYGNTQEVVVTAWSFATLEIPSPKLFLEIDNRADWLIQNGNAQDISIITWAFSHFKYRSPKLLEEAAKVRGAWLVSQGTTKDIAAAAMAYSNYGYTADAFFQALADDISFLITNGSPQEIINVCYAMTILRLGKKHANAFRKLWKVAIHLEPDMLANAELVQLGQTFVYSTADGIDMEEMSPALLSKIQNAIPGEDMNQNMVCKQVARLLGELGVDSEEEGSPLAGSTFDNGMLSIDLLCRSHSLAVEYDGTYHFLKELGTGVVTRIEDGTTQAKRRFLQQKGWKVINIDYRDWSEIKEDASKLLFLRDKLCQAGIQTQVESELLGEKAAPVCSYASIVRSRSNSA